MIPDFKIGLRRGGSWRLQRILTTYGAFGEPVFAVTMVFSRPSGTRPALLIVTIGWQ